MKMLFLKSERNLMEDEPKEVQWPDYVLDNELIKSTFKKVTF